MYHLPGKAAHASAIHADDLLYLCSIFLEWQLMPVQYMQMQERCYLDIKGHLHVLYWHELPFKEDAT
jgi:hypothetical protein